MKTLVAALVVFFAAAAVADDEPALPDGGSLVTGSPADGGSAIVADVGHATFQWTMALRCEGAQSTRYHLCATALPCPVTTANQLLDADRTFDIPVNRNAAGKRYLSLAQDDGGIPSCKVQINK